MTTERDGPKDPVKVMARHEPIDRVFVLARLWRLPPLYSFEYKALGYYYSSLFTGLHDMIEGNGFDTPEAGPSGWALRGQASNGELRRRYPEHQSVPEVSTGRWQLKVQHIIYESLHD
jgi:hypothetical protein